MSITFNSFALVAGQIKKSSEEKEVLLPAPQVSFAAPMDFQLRQNGRRLKNRNSWGFLCEV